MMRRRLRCTKRWTVFFSEIGTDIGHPRVVEHVNMKAYVQATRHLVYVLFDSLIASHRNGKLLAPWRETCVE